MHICVQYWRDDTLVILNWLCENVCRSLLAWKHSFAFAEVVSVEETEESHISPDRHISCSDCIYLRVESDVMLPVTVSLLSTVNHKCEIGTGSLLALMALIRPNVLMQYFCWDISSHLPAFIFFRCLQLLIEILNYTVITKSELKC